MQHSIELRRRSGEGLLKSSDDGPVLEDRGAAGFGLWNDDAAAARRNQAQQQQQQQQKRQRQRRRRVFFLAAAALLSLLALFASSRRGRGPPSGQGATSSLVGLLPPPPSAACAPAGAAARLALFPRSRLGGFSFPTATGLFDQAEAASEAQELIDQGWLLYRGFHRAAAAAAFSAALARSPRSSGAAAGLAWSLGPGANAAASDVAVPWPAFEASRDFPRAAEAAATALRLAEEAAEKLEELEEQEAEGGGGDDDDADGGDSDESSRRRRRRFLVQRDLSLARIAAVRFAPGTSSGRARGRAEAEAAAKTEEAARTPPAPPAPSSAPPSADPALLALAAELTLHEAQWDYWVLPEGRENADGDGSLLDDAAGWPAPSPIALRPHAARAAALASEALRLDPLEPLALHLAVHLAEAAPPGQAAALGLAAADALAGVVRGGGDGGERDGEDGGEGGDGDGGRVSPALEAAAAAAADGTALLPQPPAGAAEEGGARRGAAPWASAGVPHLLHMPVHLFSRAGLWADAVAAGIAASAADDALARACVESYAVEHNAAALVFAANACGRRRVAAAQAARLARSAEALGPALAYAGGTVEVTLGVATEVLFADWGAIRRRRLGGARAAPGAAVEGGQAGAEGMERRRRRWGWRWPPSASSAPARALAPPSNERGLCVAGGAEFAAAIKAAASALELAAAAEKSAAAGLGGAGGGGDPSPASAAAAAAAAVLRAEGLAASLAPEPRTRPGGGPGIYACGHAEVAQGFAALARARLLLAGGGGDERGSDGNGGGGGGGGGGGERAAAARAAAAAARARAAARALERHELLQSRAAYMEPPRSQVPLAPCLGLLHLRSGDLDAAASAFRRDLAARPANGRGLLGLALALEGLSAPSPGEAAGGEEGGEEGDEAGEERRRRLLLAATARKTRGAFEAAWRGADAPLSSPCPALSD